MDELTNQSEEMIQETAEVTQETTQETAQENTITQQVETIPQAIKVKFNHQELELPYEEAVQHIQKGMNYDKAVERARQEAAQQARDAVVEKLYQGQSWRGKPIKTEADLEKALQEQELENNIRQQYANVPEEVVNKLVEFDRFREETIAEKKAREDAERKAQSERDFKDRQKAMYNEFFEDFPEYDSEEKLKSIPKEIWAESEKWLHSGGLEGRRLADALTRHNWKQSATRAQTTGQTQQANAQNAGSSTGAAKNNTKHEAEDPMLKGFDSYK